MLILCEISIYLFLRKLYAGAGYQRPLFQAAMKKISLQIEVEIVKRFDKAVGFVLLPKRWILERVIAWLNRCRRLVKDVGELNTQCLSLLSLVVNSTYVAKAL
jgi:transposase